MHALQAQEQRRLMRQKGSAKGAFQVKFQSNVNKHKKKQNNDTRPGRLNKINNKSNNTQVFPPCPHCKKTNHPQKRCWWRSDVKCHKCGQLGHMEKICNSHQQQGEVKVAEDQPQEEQLFALHRKLSHRQWLHKSHELDRELFKELDKTALSKVRVGNGAYIAVKGKGTVAIEGQTGSKLISDVLYIPKINQNLLSVPQLLEKGYNVLFEDKNCMIKDSAGKEVFKVRMKGKSFALDFMSEEQAAVHKEVSSTILWHKRLGHFHHSGLIFMKKNNMVRGLPDIEEASPTCIAYVGGPMSTPSLNGSRYYIIFIDDMTRMCWLYFMKFKYEVADIFWKFKTLVENQSKCKMQMIKSDNGTEYTSKKFNKFYEDTGVEHQLTTPYSPQQNGTAERKNQTIMEMARCLLHDKVLPKKFWAEAVNTAVFLLNRLPTKALQQRTPFEAWYGYKPELFNLKIFGCLCFSYIPHIKREKLHKKAEPVIFVGYSLISKAYRIYLPHKNKVIVSRNVKFLEFDCWSWKDNKFLEQIDCLNWKGNSELGLQEENEDMDDEPVRGTRLLSDIYQRCNVAIMEPGRYEDVATDKKWINAMEEELKMIEKKSDVGVGGTKFNPDGSVNKYKARLVVKGYAHMFGVDFSETFALVARLDTIRLLLALATQKGWLIHQLDVKSTFLNGYLEEEIFVEQAEGFALQGQEDKVYLLKKALYGLKQAPRSWYSRIDAHLMSLGFVKSLTEYTLYIKKVNEDILMISLYVDDLFVTGSCKEMIEKFKEEMENVFEMTNLGKMTFFLGMQVQQKKNQIFVCQEKYAKEVLMKFNMGECKSAATPMNQKEKFCREDGAEKILNRMLNVLTATRLDIMHSVSLLSRYMHCASEIYFQAAKRILRYVKGTIDYGIWFNIVESLSFHGYSDSDWAGCVDDMRSTSEAEYVVVAAVVNQTVWIRKIMADLHIEQEDSTKIFVDNQAVISIANNPVFHGKTKNFKIKLFFLREVQREGQVKLVYCITENQVADILTKALPKSRFEFLRQKLGVCSSKVKDDY
ncbi:hypothetical protein V8G54_015131 [Vigna mungo]|uniref:Retrovirus-related Pol polyprotein from transposon TNT 1-94 n=1 Tax=Vigna mungo TaxID=3915 RepID=A0AAQ3NIU4_VIGMU